MSFTPAVTRLHNPLAAAMRPFEGKELETAEVIEKFIEAFPHLNDKKDWVQPSDHCRNHICEGACECAQTVGAIFEQVKRG
jgi:hypothetical protein